MSIPLWRNKRYISNQISRAPCTSVCGLLEVVIFYPFVQFRSLLQDFSFFDSQTPRYLVTESNRIASLAQFVPIYDVFSLKAENGWGEKSNLRLRKQFGRKSAQEISEQGDINSVCLAYQTIRMRRVSQGSGRSLELLRWLLFMPLGEVLNYLSKEITLLRLIH